MTARRLVLVVVIVALGAGALGVGALGAGGAVGEQALSAQALGGCAPGPNCKQCCFLAYRACRVGGGDPQECADAYLQCRSDCLP